MYFSRLRNSSGVVIQNQDIGKILHKIMHNIMSSKFYCIESASRYFLICAICVI